MGTNDVKLCEKRLLRAEKLMDNFLLAWDNSEMSNLVAAVDKMRRFLEQR